MAKLIEEVYGEALFELALEENKTESLLKEVCEVKQVLLENPELSKLMLHPGVPVDEKEKILENIWEGKISREVMGLMLLLLKKEHYKQLPLVLDGFLAKVKEHEKIGVVYVKSAVSLSDDQKKKVEERLLETTKYKSLEMHFEVDESLIGGVVIRIGDRVLDNTIKSRLETLSRQLYQTKLQ